MIWPVTGTTGHTECVQIMFDPQQVSFARLCDLFWERLGDSRFLPNQVGNDRGTQVCHIWMSYGCVMNEICHEWVMVHGNESWYIRMRHGTYEWAMDMSWIRYVLNYMRHVAREWVMSYTNESWYIWISHVTYEWVMSHMNEMSHGTYKWVMVPMNESCHM